MRPRPPTAGSPARGAATSILAAIGNTPLVRLQRCAPRNGAELWVKLEYTNPTGSMKDRMALAMIEGAEHDGLLSAGDTVVEYTGGSTGPSLALVCQAKGYRALIVMADCFTEERFQLLRALGAEIDVVPSAEGRPRVTPRDIANMVARAAELAQQPHHYATDPFNNPYIISGHRDGARPRDMAADRRARHRVLPGHRHRQLADGHFRRPKAPRGEDRGARAGRLGRAARRPTRSVRDAGWAGSIVPQWDPQRIDHVETIDDAEALNMTRRLAREEGIFAGISTGANLVGAHRLAERLGPDAVIVTLAVDSGFKYLSVSPFADM